MRIAHVALYSPKGEKHVKNSGVASYTKNLVARINTEHEQHVVAQKQGAVPDQYDENGVTVHRVFDRKPQFFWQIHSELRRINPDVVHIQQELAIYGGPLTALLLQCLALFWRKKTIITLHGVVDLKLIDKKFIRENGYRFLPVWSVRLAMQIIYKPLISLSRRVIVHEEKFKTILVSQYGARPGSVSVIPHGIETFEVMDQKKARQQLELPMSADIVLFVGYATGYKGIDLLIEGFAEYAKMNSKAYLVIGAGEHPRVRETVEYQMKYQKWRQKAAELIPSSQYRWEGFIAADQITAFYSACDVSVFPYQAALASSGPMSMAIGHEKPFLASNVFEGIFDSGVLFTKLPYYMAQKLNHFFSHTKEYEEYPKLLRRERTWEKVAEKTEEEYLQTVNGETDEAEERIAAG